MGRDSGFYLITRAAYVRLCIKQQCTQPEMYQDDLERGEMRAGNNFMTRNNHLIPYDMVVSCNLPQHDDDDDDSDEDSDEYEAASIFDLIKEAMESTDKDDMAGALMFYALVLKESTDTYCYAVIHNG